MGYRFEAKPTALGCTLLQVIPHDRRQDFTSKAYVLTADEVRALIAVLDIVPDVQEERSCET